MALRTRWWLPATTATAAVLMGTATPLASAAGEPAANAGAPYVFEDGSYPGSDQVLAETGAKLIRGDGNITHTPCDKPYQIKVWARDLKLPEERMCFAAPQGTGFLTVSIPGAYRIQTYERSVKASISVKNETQSLDIPGNTSKGFGEAGADQSAAVLLELRVTGTSSTTPPGAGQPIDTAGLAFNTKLTIGDGKRSCSGALVDPYWVLTAKSCFAEDPAKSNTVAAGPPKDKTTAVVGKSVLISSGGHTSDIAELAPHPDRDLVMARLSEPATDITPVPLAATAPATGQELTVAGFGRTKTEWIPATRHQAVFTAGNVTATGFDLAAKTPADATVCAGDAGGAAFRSENGKPALVGITSLGWQGGCLGTPATETRSGAFSTRVNDLHGWFQRLRAKSSPGWKTQALVQSGSSLYQGVRLNDGSWTGFDDVQAQAAAGSIGGIRNSAAVGMNGDTHVVAVSNSGGLFHTVRKQDGTWGTWGDVFNVAGTLGNLTSVTAFNNGWDLHVVAVADGKALHTVRNAEGHWTPFWDITSGTISNVTAAATAVVRGELHVTTVSGGKAYHTIRQGNGNWLGWGDVAGAAGPTGPITSISTVGAGDETHIVIATDNGTRQYHAVRNFNGTWTPLTELKDVLGTVTAKSVATANVDGEVVVAVTTADNKLLHTTRHTDRTWATTTAVPLQGLPGAPGALAITGTWND
ncbi:trypsin-like serine protease [Streptomyces sp. NPDC002054]|uniref:trypsin-like serine protease n=1 Tax=Streptomyces sp. NPDC002054 TaxID=3154663 RepID=UPI00332804C7